MKLIKLECPDCGARIEFNPELNKIICNYCGAEIIIDDEATSLDRVESVKFKHRVKNYEQDIQEIRDKENLKDEKEKKAWKMVGKMWLIIGIAWALLIIFLGFRKSGNLTCYIEDKQYYLTFGKNENIVCAACSEEMIKELNDNYNANDYNNTYKNIESYFTNLGGYCGYKSDSE